MAKLLEIAIQNAVADEEGMHDSLAVNWTRLHDLNQFDAIESIEGFLGC